MSASGFDELALADLRRAIAAIPGIRTVIDGAPREYEQGETAFTSKDLPCVWVWEGEMAPRANAMNGLAFWALPVSIECAFEYPVKQGPRPEGRRLKNAIIKAIFADTGRGVKDNGAPVAFDTLLSSAFVGRLTTGVHCGGARLEIEVHFNSAFNDLARAA